MLLERLIIGVFVRYFRIFVLFVEYILHINEGLLVAPDYLSLVEEDSVEVLELDQDLLFLLVDHVSTKQGRVATQSLSERSGGVGLELMEGDLDGSLLLVDDDILFVTLEVRNDIVVLLEAVEDVAVDICYILPLWRFYHKVAEVEDGLNNFGGFEFDGDCALLSEN